MSPIEAKFFRTWESFQAGDRFTVNPGSFHSIGTGGTNDPFMTIECDQSDEFGVVKVSKDRFLSPIKFQVLPPNPAIDIHKDGPLFTRSDQLRLSDANELIAVFSHQEPHERGGRRWSFVRQKIPSFRQRR